MNPDVKSSTDMITIMVDFFKVTVLLASSFPEGMIGTSTSTLSIYTVCVLYVVVFNVLLKIPLVVVAVAVVVAAVSYCCCFQ